MKCILLSAALSLWAFPVLAGDLSEYHCYVEWVASEAHSQPPGEVEPWLLLRAARNDRVGFAIIIIPKIGLILHETQYEGLLIGHVEIRGVPHELSWFEERFVLSWSEGAYGGFCEGI